MQRAETGVQADRGDEAEGWDGNQPKDDLGGMFVLTLDELTTLL